MRSLLLAAILIPNLSLAAEIKCKEALNRELALFQLGTVDSPALGVDKGTEEFDSEGNQEVSTLDTLAVKFKSKPLNLKVLYGTYVSSHTTEYEYSQEGIEISATMPMGGTLSRFIALDRRDCHVLAIYDGPRDSMVQVGSSSCQAMQPFNFRWPSRENPDAHSPVWIFGNAKRAGADIYKNFIASQDGRHLEFEAVERGLALCNSYGLTPAANAASAKRAAPASGNSFSRANDSIKEVWGVK
jgi:hypothetical protein